MKSQKITNLKRLLRNLGLERRLTSREMQLKSKSAVITGGLMGIGRAIAQLFTREGCRVVIGDVVEDRGTETKNEDCKRGGDCLFIKCDVSKAEQVKSIVREAVSYCGIINILVNNAGIWRPGRVTDLTEKTWDQVIDTNLKGIFLVSKEIIPIMLKAGDGSIVNIASVAGLVGVSVLVVDGGFTASFELYRIFDQYLTCE